MVVETVDALKRRCNKLKVPMADLKVFVGENSRVPGAFGVCKEGSDFVVYRNRRDGGWTERYRGANEAVAVEHMLNKLHDLACAELVRCGDTGDEPLYWARNLAGKDADQYQVSNPAQPDYTEAREGGAALLGMVMRMR